MNSPSICLQTSLKRITFKIRFYRESAQMGQMQAADGLSVGYRSYQRIESDEANCDICFLYRFCNLFKVDFNSLASPNAPVIDHNLLIFRKAEEFKKFEMIPLIMNSNLMELSQKIESETMSVGDLAESAEFLNAEFNLCISTPFKDIYNNASVKSLRLLKNQNKRMINFSDIQEQVNYWDCIFYYSPKYSIKNNFMIDINGEKIKFLVYTVHIYQRENILNITLLKFL